ncbi:kinesin heavy chain [Cryptosporidium sp. chipmunk genotype I]|uniref:kinesin heavy chain n=1 Tax=Cryptosporidium sp. chipmunk genotype I TaxID=1280935 RepID=UPI003519E43E|nr:kinesin heavy chain [Cryptosporidium sp. chipmunk genotype I]
MENRQIHINSNFNIKTCDKFKGELSSQTLEGEMKAGVKSKKVSQVFDGIGKVSNSNRIHLNRENVRVIVRVRPIQDCNESSSTCVSIVNEQKNQTKQIILEDPRHRGLPKKYEFDEIYGTESTTEDIYSKEIKDYVDPLLSECSCINIFAFGSSGTGKTFTMHGGFNSEIGIVGLTIKQLIEINCKQIEPGSFSFSFFEVYCEKIQDLLTETENLENLIKPIKPTKSKVSIRTDICGRIRVVGTNTSEFKTWDEFNIAYTSALKRRTSGKTAVNSNSSRSHACIQISYIPPVSNIAHNEVEVGNEDTIENRRRRGSISFHVKPKVNLNYPRTIVNLIDLSGFENNKITNNTGKRMSESTFINSSLLSLSKVINALKKNAGTQSTQSCIPYRESKLTRLLQEYLGGGADPPYSPYCLRCIMICTISPSITFFQQTYATLNTPSYGNNSIMRKYIGIASSVIGKDSKSSSEINKVPLASQKINSNRPLSKIITGGKGSNSKPTNPIAITSNGKRLSVRADNELLFRKNLYKNVESRVAQMIRGKTPLNISKPKKFGAINPGEIPKGSVKGNNSYANIAKQPNSIGSVENRYIDVKEPEEKLIPSGIEFDKIDCKSTRFKNGVLGKNEFLTNELVLPEDCENSRSYPISTKDREFIGGSAENKSIHANVEILDYKGEKINLESNKNNSCSSTKDKNLSEMRINRPVTRSQTKKA